MICTARTIYLGNEAVRASFRGRKNQSTRCRLSDSLRKLGGKFENFLILICRLSDSLRKLDGKFENFLIFIPNLSVMESMV